MRTLGWIAKIIVLVAFAIPALAQPESDDIVVTARKMKWKRGLYCSLVLSEQGREIYVNHQIYIPRCESCYDKKTEPNYWGLIVREGMSAPTVLSTESKNDIYYDLINSPQHCGREDVRCVGFMVTVHPDTNGVPHNDWSGVPHWDAQKQVPAGTPTWIGPETSDFTNSMHFILDGTQYDLNCTIR
ncbi:MAG: hypothetical protein EOP05_22350 [Proteobacteria bacterium]|nr:MAG: hypothetical protein EOP05_22350 [Pseudomonadota bacterium]